MSSVAFGLGVTLTHAVIVAFVVSLTSVHTTPYIWGFPLALGVVAGALAALSCWWFQLRLAAGRSVLLGAIASVVAILSMQLSSFALGGPGFVAVWLVTLVAGAILAPVLGAPRSNYVLQRTPGT